MITSQEEVPEKICIVYKNFTNTHRTTNKYLPTQVSLKMVLVIIFHPFEAEIHEG